MADTIPAHSTTEFSTNWIHRAQQMTGRLDPYVIDETFDGERKRYDRIDAQTSRERTERKGPTVIEDASTDSRWAYRRSFEKTNLLDRDDEKNLGKLILPDGDYVKSHAAAYHRDADDIAWATALDDVKTGELGTTNTALPSGQKILHGSAGLTLAKLIEAREIIDNADYDDDAPRVMVVTAFQLTDLLNTTEVKSADYNTVKALVQGQVDSFMGFKFVRIKRLRKVSTTRTCVAWVKGAIKRIKGPMSSDISIRKDLSFSIQVASMWHLGGTRVHDEGVVSIECTE